MPGIFYQALDRRTFLSRSAAAFGAGVLGFRARASANAADPTASSKEIHLALLSDTHIPADPKGGVHRKFLPWENLKLVVPQVTAVRPEAVIINGDAARLTGELDDYRELKQSLTPIAAAAPVYIGLGNHDNRANFSKVFDEPLAGRQSVKDKHVLVVEWPALRIIVLDSLLYVNQVAGLLGKIQREWLGQFLEKSDGRSIVLFVHHTLDDADGSLLDVDRLFQLIRPHAKVKAIFYGHSHEYSFKEERGVHLVNLPAVGYNFADKEPVGWVDAKFTVEGADLTLKAIAGNRRDDGQSRFITWKS